MIDSYDSSVYDPQGSRPGSSQGSFDYGRATHRAQHPARPRTSQNAAQSSLPQNAHGQNHVQIYVHDQRHHALLTDTLNSSLNQGYDNGRPGARHSRNQSLNLEYNGFPTGSQPPPHPQNQGYQQPQPTFDAYNYEQTPHARGYDHNLTYSPTPNPGTLNASTASAPRSLEPTPEWKARLRRRIDENVEQLLRDAKASYEAKLNATRRASEAHGPIAMTPEQRQLQILLRGSTGTPSSASAAAAGLGSPYSGSPLRGSWSPYDHHPPATPAPQGRVHAPQPVAPSSLVPNILAVADRAPAPSGSISAVSDIEDTTVHRRRLYLDYLQTVQDLKAFARDEYCYAVERERVEMQWYAEAEAEAEGSRSADGEAYAEIDEKQKEEQYLMLNAFHQELEKARAKAVLIEGPAGDAARRPSVRFSLDQDSSLDSSADSEVESSAEHSFDSEADGSGDEGEEDEGPGTPVVPPSNLPPLDLDAHFHAHAEELSRLLSATPSPPHSPSAAPSAQLPSFYLDESDSSDIYSGSPYSNVHPDSYLTDSSSYIDGSPDFALGSSPCIDHGNSPALSSYGPSPAPSPAMSAYPSPSPPSTPALSGSEDAGISSVESSIIFNPADSSLGAAAEKALVLKGKGSLFFRPHHSVIDEEVQRRAEKRAEQQAEFRRKAEEIKKKRDEERRRRKEAEGKEVKAIEAAPREAESSGKELVVAAKPTEGAGNFPPSSLFASQGQALIVARMASPPPFTPFTNPHSIHNLNKSPPATPYTRSPPATPYTHPQSIHNLNSRSRSLGRTSAPVSASSSHSSLASYYGVHGQHRSATPAPAGRSQQPPAATTAKSKGEATLKDPKAYQTIYAGEFGFDDEELGVDDLAFGYNGFEDDDEW